MPIGVRIFFWLCVALIAWWLFVALRFLAFPSEEYLAMIARIRAVTGFDARREDMIAVGGKTLIWSSLVLVLAWLAAYRRINWARWAVALVFAYGYVMSFAVAIYFGTLSRYLHDYFHAHWSTPESYVVFAIQAAAIVCVFLPEARGWFKTADR